MIRQRDEVRVRGMGEVWRKKAGSRIILDGNNKREKKRAVSQSVSHTQIRSRYIIR